MEGAHSNGQRKLVSRVAHWKLSEVQYSSDNHQDPRYGGALIYHFLSELGFLSSLFSQTVLEILVPNMPIFN